MGTRSTKWDKNGNKVGTTWDQEPENGQVWEQSGNKARARIPKWDKNENKVGTRAPKWEQE